MSDSTEIRLNRRVVLLSFVSLAAAACAAPAASPPGAPATQPTAAPAAKPTTAPAANPAADAKPAAASPAAKPAEKAAAPILAKPEQLTVAYSAISAGNSVMWVTNEAGIFKRNNLELDLRFGGSGPNTVLAMIAGEFKIAGVAGSSVVNAAVEGEDLIAFIGVFNAPPYFVIGQKNITRPTDLDGKKIGVSQLGGAADKTLRASLKKSGVDPNRTTILRVGGPAERFSALLTGAIDAAVIEAPETLEARKEGLPVVIDMRKLGISYAHIGVATTKKYLNERPDVVKAFAKSMVEGSAFYKDPANKEAVIKHLMSFYKNDNREAMEETYRDVLELAANPPYPTAASYQAVIDDLIEEGKQVQIKGEDVITLQPLKSLEADGLVKPPTA